jgi:hypothetical protein
MKKIFIIILVLINGFCFGQSQEAKQLLLDVEKLAQLKTMLANMKTGYQIIYKGTTAIRDISSGNFNLHKDFLDGLMQVSPAIRTYSKVADIIRYQLAIIKQYKVAFQAFKEDQSFTADEINYMGKVYGNLFNESVKNLDQLAMVITAGKLRMTDDERMGAIDQIYNSIEDQFSFLQDFNTSTQYLSLQRKSEQVEIEMSRKIHGY